jgi:hypothetical protein
MAAQVVASRAVVSSTELVSYGLHECHVRFEVFTAVTMKNSVFWDIKTQFVPHRRKNFHVYLRSWFLCVEYEERISSSSYNKAQRSAALI